jgi:hypothetical protein
MKEVEESQCVQKVHCQAVGVEPEFEQELDYLDPARIEGGPVVGPEEHQGNLVGWVEDKKGESHADYRLVLYWKPCWLLIFDKTLLHLTLGFNACKLHIHEKE